MVVHALGCTVSLLRALARHNHLPNLPGWTDNPSAAQSRCIRVHPAGALSRSHSSQLLSLAEPPSRGGVTVPSC
jgi:hypothetical protein